MLLSRYDWPQGNNGKVSSSFRGLVLSNIQTLRARKQAHLEEIEENKKAYDSEIKLQDTVSLSKYSAMRHDALLDWVNDRATKKRDFNVGLFDCTFYLDDIGTNYDHFQNSLKAI